MLPAIERSGLLITDIEILRLHYAETLRAWRERFLAHREEAERIYDQRFVRMWEFYLAASEVAFREQAMMVMQIQLTKRQGVVPITRDYIAARGGAAARARRRPASAAAAGRRIGRVKSLPENSPPRIQSPCVNVGTAKPPAPFAASAVLSQSGAVLLHGHQIAPIAEDHVESANM